MKIRPVPSLGSGLLPLAATAVIACGAGFGLGRMTAPSGADSAKGDSGGVNSGDEARGRESSWESVGSRETVANEESVARAASIGNPRQRDRALEDVFAKAGLDEVKKALAWAESLPDGPMKKAALEKILKRWGELDGAGAAAYAVKVYEETGNAGLLREALAGWAEKDPQGAMKQLESLGLGDGLRRDIRRDLLGQWTDQNPVAAATYAAANRNTNSWGGLVSVVADEWSKRDPQAATAWAAGLDTGRDKRGAIDEAIKGWAESDLGGAAAYVSSQPPGESRDVMAGSLARQIGRENPAAGLKWAAMVSDPGNQQRAVTGIVFGVYRRDPTKALELLQGSPVPPPVQQAVLSRMTNWGRRGAPGN